MVMWKKRNDVREKNLAVRSERALVAVSERRERDGAILVGNLCERVHANGAFH